MTWTIVGKITVSLLVVIVLSLAADFVAFLMDAGRRAITIGVFTGITFSTIYNRIWE